MENENAVDSRSQYCQTCNQEKQGRFCTNCNKKTPSRYEVFISTTAKAETSLGIVQRESGIKKWFRKTFQGFQKSNDAKNHPRGVYITRDINRKDDLYDEVVQDKETGKITRECHEPLSKHIGRGSAKFKK